MNRFTYSFFLSVLVHLVLLFISINIISTHKIIESQFQLVMRQNVPKPLNTKSESKPEQQQMTPHIFDVPKKVIPSFERHNSDTTNLKTEPVVKSPNLSYHITKLKQQDILFHSANSKIQSKDQYINSLFQKFTSGLSSKSSVKSNGLRDYYLSRDAGTLQASLIPPPEKNEKVYKTNYKYIPNAIQLHALSVLDSHQTLDQTSLYLQMNNKKSMTMETFLDDMNQLYKKGFVKRKKVSPEQLFMFFGIPFEMSATNRKNPVYSYSMQIDCSKLKHHLESEIDKITEKEAICKSDSIQLNQLKHKLEIIR